MIVTLAAMRKRRGLNQRELADKSGVPQPMISMIERGVVPNPRVDTMYKLSVALKCTVDDLVADGDKPA